ncbi:FKBP-type peptidyl-prolyl cis-trans isomerase [Chitinophaga nivalis]|uniref:Peptidyl-prolyl cis-trans isomerase n=1 Tax=Chitinophaga nivalis TaxID=2991709 RepID=A0ABT3IQL6_9BACT|nr:FKBP-type peptidyl-prolyl cis-trans isomerase [Chitinophaga nivalis]MCW3464300.1 FKBP-type peptidyl-prolyl cis-trans isomerase [Chitinophaga nivalis]MCW3486009.1 FKBP-type peptidyl-prolyl cis-trans isomerase [Chitinophaga nivalis]
MRKVFLLGCLLALVFVACNKKDNPEPPYDPYPQYQQDSTNIQAYLKANNITALQDSFGIFYKIVKRGEIKDTVRRTSNVTVGYKGYLLNKTQFDGKDTASFELPRLIPAWQIALPRIGKGGEIHIYVPSFYGYGTRATGSIPANSPLVFEIKLHDFTPAK